MIADLRTSTFVTLFYGVLDPAAATLTYCNAGHIPPYLFSRGEDPVRALRRTGPALGVLQDVTWEQGIVHLNPGDVLVLYTDGVTEAQNEGEAFFGAERLKASASARLGHPAQHIRDSILADIAGFAGNAPRARRDDVALVVIARSLPERP
jgi:serine phosphatase RsbU (regulator of sigma subunit)